MAVSAKQTVSKSDRRDLRSSFRVRPSPSEPIRGTLRMSGAEVAVTVHDLSVNGVALVAPLKLRPMQPAGTHVELALHLTCGLGRFILPASLVRIESSSRHALVALNFTAHRATGFDLQEQRLHTYVMRRQHDAVVVTRRR